MSDNKPTVGGQAVIEGVMMRAPGSVATAVREANGHIAVQVKAVESLGDRYPIFRAPFLRGVVSLGESLVLGMRSLSYSARMAGEDDEEMTDGEVAMTMIFAFLLAAVLFIAVPTYGVKIFHAVSEDPLYLNIFEGCLRLAVFLAYIFSISRMEGIYRVFQYHGAEHKTIHCFEKGEALTVANVQKCSRFHPRCGTAFLLIVMIVSIFVFAFLGWPGLAERIISRVVLLPVIAGISYELIRLAGKHPNGLMHIFILPGLWLQRLTTNEPGDEMVEVAIESLKAVLAREDIPSGSGNYADLRYGEAVAAVGDFGTAVTAEATGGK